jgi:hypothetical protein
VTEAAKITFWAEAALLWVQVQVMPQSMRGFVRRPILFTVNDHSEALNAAHR